MLCTGSSSTNLCANHSGRGLVGVVLSSTPGASRTGIGDATRLWHKEPCEIASSGLTYGPAHVNTHYPGTDHNAALRLLTDDDDKGEAVAVFNTLTFHTQHRICQEDDTDSIP